MTRSPAQYVILKWIRGRWRWYAGRSYSTAYGHGPRTWVDELSHAGLYGRQNVYNQQVPGRHIILPMYRAKQVDARMRRGLSPFDDLIV